MKLKYKRLKNTAWVILHLTFAVPASSFWRLPSLSVIKECFALKLLVFTVGHRFPCLHYLAYASIRLASALGAPITGTNRAGATPLHVAAYYGNTGAVSALLQSGVATDKKDASIGRTPLAFAARNGHSSIIHSLIKAGANPDSWDKDHMTPLHLATKYQLTPAVKLLLRLGANPNIKGGWGEYTPLHIAAQNNSVAITKELLKFGANKKIRDGLFDTAYDLACKRNHPQIMELLDNSPITTFLAGRLCERVGKKSILSSVPADIIVRIAQEAAQ
jgi:ankyrin repeat protein